MVRWVRLGESRQPTPGLASPRSLEASSEHLGFSLTDLGWYTPFSKDGEALARSICPMTLVIAK